MKFTQHYMICSEATVNLKQSTELYQSMQLLLEAALSVNVSSLPTNL